MAGLAQGFRVADSAAMGDSASIGGYSGGESCLRLGVDSFCLVMAMLENLSLGSRRYSARRRMPKGPWTDAQTFNASPDGPGA